MAVPWPLSQASPLLGATRTPDSGVVRTAVEAGPDLVRRRVTAVVVAYECRMLLTQEDYATIVHFHDEVLAGGSLPFAWTDPMTGMSATARFLPPGPACSFGSPGSAATRLVSVSFGLEVLP